MTGLLAAWLGGAHAARAVPVEVAFQGTIRMVAGSVPGGSVPEGEPFEGTLVYDSERPAGQGPKAYYVFEDGAAALSVSLAGIRYATDPSDPWVSIGISNDLLVDRYTGEEVPEYSPEAVLSDSFGAGSVNNILVGGVDYEISLGFFEVSEDRQPGLFDSVALPSSSGWLAEHLVGGDVEIRGGGGDYFDLIGTVTTATVVPEPTTAALLCVGLALLAALRRQA